MLNVVAGDIDRPISLAALSSSGQPMDAETYPVMCGFDIQNRYLPFPHEPHGECMGAREHGKVAQILREDMVAQPRIRSGYEREVAVVRITSTVLEVKLE